MGGGVSLDGEIAEAKQITVDFAAAFVKNYSKLYVIGLMKDAKKRLKKKAAGPQWKLLKVDKEPPPPIRHQGMLLKLSKHLKNWNPRYTIIRGDWIVEYWETEEKYKSGAKSRGTINLSGLTVVRDVNNTLINRIMALAEKCNLPVDQLPKPEQYPDFTIQLFHERREAIYLQAANAEDFKKWCDMLDNCRWYAPSYDINDDKIHRAVFSWALWRTRWEVDMWGWWSSGGGETAMIADCINEQIAWKVMGKVDSKLTMPWAIRSKIRDTFMKTTGGFVTSAVKPAWGACYEAVKKVRPTVSGKIDEMMEPIVEACGKVEAKIIEMVEQASKQTLEEKVTPNLAPLLDVVFGPVIDAMQIVVRAFDEAVIKMRADEKYANHKDDKRMYFCSHYSYNPLFWDADNKLWGLYDILWDMRRIFDDVSPWGILYKCRRRVRKLMQNALFTFETLLEQEGNEGFDATLARVREMLLEDCKAAVMRILGQILFGVVEPMWEKVVIRPSRKLVSPLCEMIPEPLREFLDVEDMLEGVLYNILRACCATVFAPYASRVSI